MHECALSAGAPRASLIDARNCNERNDQISASTLRAYTMPARDSYSKNENELANSCRASLRDSRNFAVFAL
jgi:hypothetical protein